MSIFQIYAMHDAAVGFCNPVTDQNDQLAMRHFQAACQNSDDMQVKPSDFSLYRIGSYDTETAGLTSCPPELICRADDFLRKKVKK